MLALRRRTGATVVDIVLAALCGCVRAHLVGRMARPRPLRAFMPVMGPPAAVASLGAHCGNAVSGYFLSLTAHLADPRARLDSVTRQTRRKKRWRVAAFNATVQSAALPLVPAALLPLVVDRCARAASALGASSVRGPDGGVELCGVPVRAFYYFGLFSPPTMPLMFGMGSVEGRLTVSLAASCDEIDPGALLSRLPEELEALYHSFETPNA